MGTTTNIAYPYPELTDVANVPADMRELAEAVEKSRVLVTALAGTALITAYPAGTSIMWVPFATGASWPPADQCFVVTSSSKNFATQWCSTGFGSPRMWVRTGTATQWYPWVKVVDSRGGPANVIARGRVQVSVSNAVNGTVAVTFPAGLFTGTPRVSAIAVGQSVFSAYSANAPSATGFSVGARHVDNSVVTATVNIDWLAVEGE